MKRTQLMTNKTIELETETTTETTTKPSRRRPRRHDTSKSVGTVKCGIMKRGPGQKVRYVEVTGTREVRDARLSAAINEYLLADRNHTAVYDECQRRTDEAEERCCSANENLNAIMRDLGGFAVSYRGLLFNVEDREYTAFPAYPVIHLVD
jgi:hypothetical protein